MRITVEMSLYPLKEDYTSVIIDFIKNIKSLADIEVHTTAMSTYITGDYDVVMQHLTHELKKVYQVVPDSATVIKIIPKDLNVGGGFLNF